MKITIPFDELSTAIRLAIEAKEKDQKWFESQRAKLPEDREGELQWQADNLVGGRLQGYMYAYKRLREMFQESLRAARETWSVRSWSGLREVVGDLLAAHLEQLLEEKIPKKFPWQTILSDDKPSKTLGKLWEKSELTLGAVEALIGRDKLKHQKITDSQRSLTIDFGAVRIAAIGLNKLLDELHGMEDFRKAGQEILERYEVRDEYCARRLRETASLTLVFARVADAMRQGARDFHMSSVELDLPDDERGPEPGESLAKWASNTEILKLAADTLFADLQPLKHQARLDREKALGAHQTDEPKPVPA